MEAGVISVAKRRQRVRQQLVAALTYLALILVCALFVAPFLWMVSTSLKPDTQIFQDKVEWIPRPAMWGNYPNALASFPFLLYLRNTLFVCVMVTLGTVVSSLLPAYGFSRIRWKGRDTLFVILLATIMLPAQVTMLPVFLIFRALGWTGTFLPLIVPSFFGSAFSIFLLRQFFLTIPQDLSDAARIDGCSELTTLFRVVAPLAKPAMATVALFAFTGAWMDFLTPLIYLHDESRYTLAVGLQAFLGRHNSEWSLLMAAATVITLPMVVLFFLTQKTFIRGIALTGIK
jgi:multiple sugar transport system permease protein